LRVSLSSLSPPCYPQFFIPLLYSCCFFSFSVLVSFFSICIFSRIFIFPRFCTSSVVLLCTTALSCSSFPPPVLASSLSLLLCDVLGSRGSGCCQYCVACFQHSSVLFSSGNKE
jgi:hypothetical protein